MPHTTAPTAHLRLARTVVWLVFAAIALSAAWVFDTHTSGATPLESGASARAAMTSPEPAPQVLASDAVITAAPSTPSTACSNCPEEAVNNLPAYRWSLSTMLPARDGGWFSGLKTAITSLASFPFLLAGLIWSLLLAVLRFAIGAEFLGATAPLINTAMGAVGDKVLWVAAIAGALVLLSTAKQVLAGKTKQALTRAGTFVVFIGALTAIMTASAQPAATGDQALAAKGTLPYLANRIDTSLQQVTVLTTGFGVTDGLGTGAGDTRNNGNSWTCHKYITELEARFAHQAAQESFAGPGTDTLSTVSRLWQTGYLGPWQSAAFGRPADGGTDYAALAACHHLEQEADITAQEQNAVALAAYGPNVAPSMDVYGPWVQQDYRRAFVTFWAACKNSGGNVSVTAGFGPTDTDSGHCQDVFNGGFDRLGNDLEKKFDFTDDDIDEEFSDTDEINGSNGANYRSARNFTSAYNGENMGDRVVLGLLALITAGIYLFALGALAIGLVFVKFMLIILLILMPVTLLLLALGKPGGMKLLRLTGTSAVTTALFGLLVAFIVEMTELGNWLVTGLAGTGLFSDVLRALMPLVALFAVKKVLGAMGMSDIMRPTGALSFGTQAALMATGDKQLARMARADGGNAVEKGLRKQLNKLPGGRDAQGNMTRLGERLDSRSLAGWAGHAGQTGVAAAGATGRKTRQAVRAAAGATGAAQAVSRTGAAAAGSKSGQRIIGTLSEGRAAAQAKLTAFAGANKSALATLSAVGGGAAGGAGIAALGAAALGAAAPVALGAAGVAGAGLLYKNVRNLAANGEGPAVQATAPAVAKDPAAAVLRAKKAAKTYGHLEQHAAANGGASALGELRAAHADQRLGAHAQRTFGNLELTDALVAAGAQRAYAQAREVDVERVILSTSGVATIDPAYGIDRATGIRIDYGGLDARQLAASPELFLDAPTNLKLAAITDPGARAAATYTILAERLAIDPGGEVIDLFATIGLDVNDTKDAALICEVAAGKRNHPELELIFSGKALGHAGARETQAIAAAIAWESANKFDLTAHDAQAFEERVNIVQASRAQLTTSSAALHEHVDAVQEAARAFTAAVARAENHTPGTPAAAAAHEQITQARRDLENHAAQLGGQIADIHASETVVSLDLRNAEAAAGTDLAQLARDLETSAHAGAQIAAQMTEQFEVATARLYGRDAAAAAMQLVELASTAATEITARAQATGERADAVEQELRRKAGAQQAHDIKTRPAPRVWAAKELLDSQRRELAPL